MHYRVCIFKIIEIQFTDKFPNSIKKIYKGLKTKKYLIYGLILIYNPNVLSLSKNDNL